MTLFAPTAIEDIRRHIGHPIIDCDAHFNEFGPLFREQFLEGREHSAVLTSRRHSRAGCNWRQYLVEQTSPMGQTYGSMSPRHAAMSLAERRDSGALLPSWGPPTATCSIEPRAMCQRFCMRDWARLASTIASSIPDR